MISVFRYGENESDDDHAGHDVVFLQDINAIGIRASIGASAFFALLGHGLLHYFNSKLPMRIGVKLDSLVDRTAFRK